MSDSSLLEYARLHGLAVDHRAGDLFSFLPSTSPSSFEDDQQRLQEFLCATGDVLSESKFQLKQEESHLLASCIASPNSICSTDLLPDHNRTRNLKLETPLLLTNHEYDVRDFVQKMTLEDLVAGMPLRSVNEAGGGGVSWPLGFLDLAAEWDHELSSERLKTTKEVFNFLQGTLNDQFTSTMKRDIMEESLAYTKYPRLDPVSPVLMPLEASPEPCTGFLPELQLKLCSDLVDPEMLLKKSFKFEMANQDRISLDDMLEDDQEPVPALVEYAKHGHIHDAIEEIKSEYIDPRVSTKREFAAIPKAEVPISPPGTNEKSKLELGVGEDLREVIPLSVDTLESIYCSKQESYKKEPITLGEKADREVKRQLESENLVVADIVMHVAVPKLVTVSRESPWERWKKAPVDKFFTAMIEKDDMIRAVSMDPRSDLDLNWVPFPANLSCFNTEEDFEDTGFLERALAPPANIMNSKQLLWRPECLRIFDSSDESDDGELEEDSSLVEEPKKEAQIPQKRPLLDDLVDNLAPLSSTSKSVSLLYSTLGPNFSASGSLANFLDTRGSKFKKPRFESNLVTNELIDDPIEASQRQSQTQDSTPSKIQVPATPEFSRTESGLFYSPLPPFLELDSPRAIILNASLLSTHRSLAAFLESHTKNADESCVEDKNLAIIYRDFDVGHPSSSAPLAPDIVLNPKACLISTTFQFLMQRSLPGQGMTRSGATSPVHDRILALCSTYDNLFVVLTIHAPFTSGEILKDSDSTALLAFTAFCDSLLNDLGCRVRPVLVPLTTQSSSSIHHHHSLLENPVYPSPDPLQCWVWFLVTRHAFHSHPDTPNHPQSRPIPGFSPPGVILLIQDETMWSLFLQRCVGLNPFAAQVVLATLKKADNSINQDPVNTRHLPEPLWGLRQFVQMSPAERMAVFGEVLGERALERASAVLDRRWDEIDPIVKATVDRGD